MISLLLRSVHCRTAGKHSTEPLCTGTKPETRRYKTKLQSGAIRTHFFFLEVAPSDEQTSNPWITWYFHIEDLLCRTNLLFIGHWYSWHCSWSQTPVWLLSRDFFSLRIASRSWAACEASRHQVIIAVCLKAKVTPAELIGHNVLP